MPVSALHPFSRVPESEAAAYSADVPHWWPLAQSGIFVPLDREQCWDFLGRSGTGWLSRPGAVSSPRESTKYTLTATLLALESQPSVVLPIGEIVLFQIDHFDPDQRTAWSIALVGRTAEEAPESQRVRTLGPRAFLPLASTGIFGLTLAPADRPDPRSGARGLQDPSAPGLSRGLSSCRA